MLAAGEVRYELGLRICKSDNPRQMRDTSKAKDVELMHHLYILVSHEVRTKDNDT